MSKNKLLTILNIFSVRLPVKCPGYQSPIGTNLLSISISKFPNKQINLFMVEMSVMEC